MKLSLDVHQWQILRTALRLKKATGRELRIIPNRCTKDGTFLTDFVKKRLLRVVKTGDTVWDKTYALTRAGEEAAEYGEYEGDFRTGVAADPPRRRSTKGAGKKATGVS
jgi:hypothetical protein